MAKPSYYLKKLGRRGEIRIWSVDGKKIRDSLNIEFTNFGQRFDFDFIPENELWVEKEAVVNERKFFIERMLAKRKMLEAGFTNAEAEELAAAKERVERKKVEEAQKSPSKKDPLDKIYQQIHRRLLGKTAFGLDIWLIDGENVRTNLYLDFTEGGHDLVYWFVPENEVWIDDDVCAAERLYVLLHELNERSKMAEGLNYPQAHRLSSRLEWRARHDKGTLQKNLILLGYLKDNDDRGRS